ncbi:hypothetical protein L2E82_16584 [Cichorium intybus]|uniref:Uncharacterized protein n=1 Tax=Cichorium intybus TaxID=13427 RepID=A0ACB9F6I5_CICIN|nr:hypothetical protein L2E82_16584 [Cichorium intybus]
MKQRKAKTEGDGQRMGFKAWVALPPLKAKLSTSMSGCRGSPSRPSIWPNIHISCAITLEEEDGEGGRVVVLEQWFARGEEPEEEDCASP